jgi:TnpA family transposase
MAQLTTGVSYADIQRITDWYLHDEALRAALADIVNAMLALDTTQGWGDGSTSSSDGQRFLFPQRVLRRTYSHRMGDFALEFYTFIADNYAPFYLTGCKFSVARMLRSSAQREGDRIRQERCTQKNAWDSEPA